MARALGATRWRLARDITLPLARPAIAAGLALALLETLNDIGASEYLGVQTLTLSIFTTWLNRSSLSGAAQIACFMLLLVAALIALERYGRRQQAFTGLDRHPAHARRIRLRGRNGWLAAAICIAPVTLGFVIPLGYLAHEVAARGLLIGFDPSLVEHTLTTVLIAAIATALTLALGFGAVLALRLLQRPFAAACVFIAGLGYAIPGTVLALGLLSPLIAVDEAINWVTRTVAGVGVGLVLAGSSAALVIAYAARFLAIATGFAQAGLARVAIELDDAARLSGAWPGALTRSVHLPLLRPALWGAALLIFVDCLKELPATLLLRPLNVETLSTYIYQFATRGNFEEGSMKKVYPDAKAALAGLLKDGMLIMAGGFGLCGIPETLIVAIRDSGVKNLTVVSNNAGVDGIGLGLLLDTKQVKKMISSYVGENKTFATQFLAGELEIEFNPQGTLAERIRAGGAGVPAFFTRTGAGTMIAEGKEERQFDGERYVMERGIVADLSIVHAWMGDTEGNLVYRKTARNFNPIMASAGKVTVAEVEHLVQPGDINPDHIITPGVYVQRIIHVPNATKHIEQRTVRKRDRSAAPAGTGEEV
jgi:3-oxoacid CoA-transferase A subunit